MDQENDIIIKAGKKYSYVSILAGGQRESHPDIQNFFFCCFSLGKMVQYTIQQDTNTLTVLTPTHPKSYGSMYKRNGKGRREKSDVYEEENLSIRLRAFL